MMSLTRACERQRLYRRIPWIDGGDAVGLMGEGCVDDNIPKSLFMLEARIQQQRLKKWQER